MMALDIKAGDEIITTPFSFISTAETIACMGAVPVFVDIDERTFNIDPLKIEQKITSKTKAIMVVHLYGQTVDIDAIKTIAYKYNLKIIGKNTHILFGHWAALNGITCKNNITALDTGCAWGEKLTAIRLEDNSIFSCDKLN